MKTKILLLVGTFIAAMMLAACTSAAGGLPSGLTNIPPGLEGTDEGTGTVEPSETPQVTDVPEGTQVPEGTETPEATDEAGARAGCPGNPGNQPPVAATIAAANGVTADEIMGWFCQGFGFGEIKKAYAWAKLTGMTVDELFALKAGGQGWGEIAKSLDIKPGNKPCWAGPDHGANDPTCVKPGKGKSNNSTIQGGDQGTQPPSPGNGNGKNKNKNGGSD